MSKYRAIVSITFDDDDLQYLAEALDIDNINDPQEALNGSLDNLDLGSGWLEQFYVDGEPQIFRLSSGIQVEVSDHD